MTKMDVIANPLAAIETVVSSKFSSASGGLALGNGIRSVKPRMASNGGMTNAMTHDRNGGPSGKADAGEEPNGGDLSRPRGGGKFEAPLYLVISAYLCYTFIIVVSWMGEAMGNFAAWFIPWSSTAAAGAASGSCGINKPGYAPLCGSFEGFYVRHIYRRFKNCFNVPICSVPGATVSLAERFSEDGFRTFKFRTPENDQQPGLNEQQGDGEADHHHHRQLAKRECVNLASYNYLGFAESSGYCTERAIRACRTDGLAACSSLQELGNRQVVLELERKLADFMGVEDALVVGMGFCTNTLNIPALVSKGCLVVSDECNHASLILGMRLSDATIKVFKHNDVDSLEQTLRTAIISGQPRTHRPWKKVLIIVEGIYSMEGSICPLPEIVAIKKKYGAYLYLDEAHSVGAMGPHGRGVVDHFGLDPADVDVLMGTFTKSFGAAGGYIAGSRRLINYLRTSSHANFYSSSMSPPVARQIISAIECLTYGAKGVATDDGSGQVPPDGLRRVRQLAKNSKYFRKRLMDMGFVVIGDEGSPVVPLMLFIPTKIGAFVSKCIESGVAVVGVGFPATKMTEERMRFCISAAHTKDMLDRALFTIRSVGEYTLCKYAQNWNSAR